MPHHGEQPAGVGGVAHLFRILDNKNIQTWVGMGSQVFTVGEVALAQIEVPVPCTIDLLGYETGNVVAGTTRIGLFPRNVIGWPDLPDGGALIVEAGPLAPLLGLRVHWFTIPATSLTEGVYFIAIQSNNALSTFARMFARWTHNVLGNADPGRSYLQAFGPFTTPCPITAPESVSPSVFMRVVSVP